MYHAAQKKQKKKPEDELPFWLTFTGLMMRIDGLSQDFLFGVANDAVASAAQANQIEYLHYITAEDDRVCPVCTRYGSGGEGKGYYRADGPIPLIPVHFRCRCQWELLFQNLDAPTLRK